ncbi:MAG: hypothetical protein HGB15_07815 [Chlorobaculum sp.]|nr:hypothetical protein [Chlorobaculum sp.]
MAKIEFPSQLKALLEDSDLQAPIRALADRVGEILAGSVLPFFPDYTDHGVEHVNRVLKSEVELVPKEVWERSKRDSDPRLLCDADAAVLIGATLLHDIAMHLHPKGFLELVGKDSRFQPLPWFCECHEGPAADVAWHELWAEYVREARRFSDRDLTNIIGEESARLWKFQKLPDDTGQWERNHCLIVGEFIRRHHARLAHEIAMYGFPGLPVGSGEGEFPAMGAKGLQLMHLADLIGLTARSHGLSLRVCMAYLDAHYPGNLRPMDAAVLYPMALLRVADYLQIDRQRAPSALLQLRNPQSPISVQEWQKHRAVQHIGPAKDPRCKVVTVSSDLSLSLYLQLRELLAGLQAEMDHSTAVLDEAYGTQTGLGLHHLNLAIRRVDSNLEKPVFLKSLPYVPNKTGFAADPNLLTLLVEPLYGKEPGVGVRELMQNAVDAVCELDAWCKVHDVPIDSLDLPEQEGDVMIDFIKRDDGSWFLRVQDRGIGMTSDTIQNYFLRAGASFRRSSEWSKEFVDDEGKPRVARAGRFGIGVFAVFLLGPSFKMWTRHVGADKKMGYMVEATENSQLIEIQRRDDLPVGTTIEVEISKESAEILGLDEDFAKNISWFCWDWPKVIMRVVREKSTKLLNLEYVCPIRSKKLPPNWFVIHPKGLDAVYWTFENVMHFSCNGLRIAKPSPYGLRDSRYEWLDQTQLQRPDIAVLDSAGNLPLTTQRYELSQDTVPFVNELARDVLFSYIAHALICGPTSQKDALLENNRFPLKPYPVYNVSSKSYDEALFDKGLLRWCATSVEMVPADQWLFILLKSKSCFLYGSERSEKYHDADTDFALIDLIIRNSNNHAILPLNLMIYPDSDKPTIRIHQNRQTIARVLDKIVNKGTKFFGSQIASRVLIAEAPEHHQYGVDFENDGPMSVYQSVQLLEIPSPKENYVFFELKNGIYNFSFPLETILIEMQSIKKHNTFYILAEIIPEGAAQPESMIAKIWNECLGPNPIPFDPVAREALIAEGCKHPELKRHIEAWQKMKRTGSGWVARTW